MAKELDLGELIRRKRKEMGWTQADLSEMVGVSRHTVGSWEKNVFIPAGDIFINLVNMLDLGSELFYYSPAQQPTDLPRRKDTKVTKEYYGNYQFDKDKFNAVVLFFCEPGETQTKLNKLLFYADFKHFKEYGISITGSPYARITYGPVPNNYKNYYEHLLECGFLGIREEVTHGGHRVRKLSSQEDYQIYPLKQSELKTMEHVKKYFQRFSTREITKFSHEEKGFKEIENSYLIPYKYAQYLQI